MTGSPHPQPLSSRRVENARPAQRRRLPLIAAALTIGSFSSASMAKTAPNCVAKLNKAALQALNRTNPLGQMQISGSPISFGPYLKRVEIGVYGARTEMYAVDVTIDGACNVLEASTRLETNEWPSQ